MNYIDKYGLMNVKPVGEDGMPTGNDGWILSAYAHNLGLEVNRASLRKLFHNQLDYIPDVMFPVTRLPGKFAPPVSRDVMLGWAYFKLISSSDLELNRWNFSPIKLPKFNLFKLIHQLWKLRHSHRNRFWQDPGFEQVYHTAFLCPFQDRAFYYRCSGEKVPVIYRLIEAIDKRFVKPKNDSSALIRWLKGYGDPKPVVFNRYFRDPNHPIAIAYKNR